MSRENFHIVTLFTGAVFAAIFFLTVLPPALASGDIVGAFKAGFVNPFAAGYAWDAILCWVILALWIVYEQPALGIRHGWACVLLGVVPGVAVGFAPYLYLRSKQLSDRSERLA